jgi:competence protein CoiA
MPCCRTPAVLKTSPNGRPFFAHYNDECKTTPETAWHQEGKALICAKLAGMGIVCRDEVTGGSKDAPWKADTFFQTGQRTIVIEMQRSYQHLRDYLRRQQRYASTGVESYWLTRLENYRTIVGATGKLRLKREFGGKFPPEGFGPLLPELPIAYLETGDNPLIVGAGLFSAQVDHWLQALIERRYVYDNGRWFIR